MEDDGVSAGAPTRAPPPPPPRRDTAARTEPGTAHSNHGARRSRRTAHRPSGRRARSDRKLAHLCQRAQDPTGGGGGAAESEAATALEAGGGCLDRTCGRVLSALRYAR